ncbi:MAG: arylsulfatase [Mycobacterium sp.]|uniref:arylsulfatase n=1 Tax=Mycobacterium sp. TaxID=1785 RepID=UPI000CBF8254|nr:arylsulfatase [Mycobacterium sp.]MBI2701136.1 arylsulfatase [Mycobacterium sp.]MBX9978852.1 arylsulfatase [Mycobacterium gordonae]PJE05211.1 MAG: arylsulfatase [Mycobacterium sp.]PJE12656.1 MAG: arylsulfatase [Mycobacterium sp.]
MVDLPRTAGPFAGVINPSVADSTPVKPAITYPPQGAPNVVVVLLDDVGFGASATFGGPVPTPALDRVARDGLRYNQFHTTALCSPTRAALLTGRNHHSAHMGTICEIAYGFPGYDSVIPQSTATVAEILRHNGYNTALFGKAHFTPTWELGPTGPFDRWPTGLGFERFYGFLGGDTSQYEPALFDQTTPVEPYLGRDDYHLTEDLAERAIDWIQRQQTSAPGKPFFLYFAPGATHSPHQVWPEWSDRFAGQFDDGWDALRQSIYERQIELGIIPPGTRLTPRPSQIPAWADYEDRYKPVARRLMEVYAGFLAHTDAQIGRVIDAIDDLDQWDNTLFIYICGDNGASAEGTVHGAWSSPSFQNGLPEDPEWLLAHLDDFGTARCENHYNVGWAWALDAPFQWMKQVASHFGGTRNGLAVSWPRKIAARGEQRGQFHHVIDVMPTILEAAGIQPPARVNGVEQKPVEGVSMQYSFDHPDAESRRSTQYFEIFGNRAIYHEGWIASCFHGRLPWVRTGRHPFGETERWELYNLADDFSQGVDLAVRYPEKLGDLQAVFDSEARKYDVYPLSDATLARALPANRPNLLGDRASVTYYPSHVRIPETSTLTYTSTSFRLRAHVAIPAGGAQGVVICLGGAMGGWSLYLQYGVPMFTYNYLGHEVTTVTAVEPLPEGPAVIGVSFDYDGGGLGKGATVSLLVDERNVAHGRIERTVPFRFSMSGETLDVGTDTGSPVAPYGRAFRFTGGIDRVEAVIDPRPADLAAALAEAEMRSAMGSQ